MSGLARRQQEFLAALLDEEAPLPAGWQVRHARGLAIYRNNYRGGLIDTLRDTYPRTEVLAGEAAFARAAAHHCITHPPSSWTLDQVGAGFSATCAELFRDDPDVAELAALREAAGKEQLDKKALKARSVPYEAVMVPKGTSVNLPRPALWFIGIAGAVAICAMILPGISGSYILLIFGVYFFILNALKGMLSLLASGTVPFNHILYLGVFGVALVAGILSFARVLSFLLDRYAAPTLGVLVGLMLGCLRGIWPFQQVVDGALVNILPAGDAGVTGAAIAAVVGFVLVVALSFVGARFEDEPEVESA